MCLAVVGRVLEIDGEGVSRVAVADVGGAERRIGLAFVPAARPGDWIRIHSGHALAVVPPGEAASLLDLLREVDVTAR